METPRILLVDDDPRLRQLLDKYLTEQHFLVKSVPDAQQMDRVLARDHVDLLVLDIMLPNEDGLSVCARLRHDRPELPIIMLTARGDEVDRIVGLELGADDYMPKPFNPRELVARIRSILRRQGGAPPAAPATEQGSVRIGRFELDLATRHLRTESGESVAITGGEFALLKALVMHPRQALSRDRLMMLARGREQGAFDRSIDVQISRLRKLIEDDPKSPRYIQTVWGVGYVFVPDGDPT